MGVKHVLSRHPASRGGKHRRQLPCPSGTFRIAMYNAIDMYIYQMIKIYHQSANAVASDFCTPLDAAFVKFMSPLLCVRVHMCSQYYGSLPSNVEHGQRQRQRQRDRDIER